MLNYMIIVFLNILIVTIYAFPCFMAMVYALKIFNYTNYSKWDLFLLAMWLGTVINTIIN